jgi:hypothetical protein
LGKIAESLDSAREARLLGPGSPEVYLRIHDVLLTAGRKDEAIAALLEGVLLTANAGLVRKLAGDYADSSEESRCAIWYAGNVPQIDSSCAFVRKQVCAVAGDVIRVGLEAGGPDVGQHLRDQLAAKYGCGSQPGSPLP